MRAAVVIRDARGRRECFAEDFPLRIGAGPEADIDVADDASPPDVALIGLRDGHLFAQPGDAGASVLLNDEPLARSRWLRPGDVLRVGGARVRVNAEGSALALVVRNDDDAAALEPPTEPPPAPRGGAPGTLVPPAPPARRGPSRLVRGVTLGAFALLVLVAAYVFVATFMVVEVTPAPDALSVDGALPSIAIGGHRLLIPGTYRVRASKAGYRPLDTKVNVARGSEARFEFELEKLPGLVAIESLPAAGALVRVDGVSLGVTPLVDVELEAGRHEITLELERYRDAVRVIEVTGLGERQRLSAELEPRWAEVTIASRPSGARVLLDGEDMGRTPLDAEIMEGDHDLLLALEGYASHARRLAVTAGETRSLDDIVLQPAAGVVAVESVPSGVTVSVDGVYRGETPLEIALSPGEKHELRLSNAGYQALRRTLSVEPASTARLRLELTPLIGTVFIASDPADAQLWVDGVRVGPATGRHELTAMRHVLEVRSPGYESHRSEFTPRSGVSQRLDVRLVSAAAVERARIPSEVRTAAGQVLRLMRPAPTPFPMGASRREPGQRANEVLRDVALSRAYYLSVDEVTNDEYRRFAPDHRSGVLSGHSLDGGTQPVVSVSWEDAVRYLNWLSEQDSLAPAYARNGDRFELVMPPTTGYRLPSEAEWAWAARYADNAGALKYPWGEGFPPGPGAGNYADGAAAGIVPNRVPGYEDGFAVSAPVGSFAANAAGIRDLGGNVAEWCHDYYSIPAAGAGPEVDPLGPASGRHHVVRGASWRHAGIGELRLSYRDYSEEPRTDVGFRIARYAE